MNKTQTLMFRWSIVLSALIAMFWGIVFYVDGIIPHITTISLTNQWSLMLPFHVSRWFDILLGPIGSIVFVTAYTESKKRNHEDLFFIALMGPLCLGLFVGLDSGIIMGLIIGLITTLIVVLMKGFIRSIPQKS